MNISSRRIDIVEAKHRVIEPAAADRLVETERIVGLEVNRRRLNLVTVWIVVPTGFEKKNRSPTFTDGTPSAGLPASQSGRSPTFNDDPSAESLGSGAGGIPTSSPASAHQGPSRP